MRFLQPMVRAILVALVINIVLLSQAQAQATRDQNARPEPPKIIRKSGGVLAGEAVTKVEPAYPPLAKAARVSGQVVVEITIDEEGNVIAARALSGHPLLKDASVNAARGWKFKPTLLQGEPVKVIGALTFNFNLGHSNDIEAIKREIAASPNSPELHYKLGLAYHFDGQDEKAIEAFNQTIQLKPDYADAYEQLGKAYGVLGQMEKAIEALKQALTFKPGDPDVYIELSRVYFKADRYEEALEAARQALNLNPNPNQVDEAVSTVALTMVRQKRFNEAIEFLKQLADLHPDTPAIRLYLGIAYGLTGDRESAMKIHEALKEKNPELAKQLLDLIDKKQ